MSLSADLTVSVDLVFIGGQLLQTHGASCVQLLCADADLGTKSKFKSIRKACGCIDIDTGSIHFV